MVIFGHFKLTSLENMGKKNKFLDVLLHMYFLQRKIWPGNISSSITKTCYKMQKKCLKYNFHSFFFFFHFQGFEIRWEVQENYQVSSRCSVLYIFPQRNTLESTWNLKEDAQKVSKVTISSHFWEIWKNCKIFKRFFFHWKSSEEKILA